MGSHEASLADLGLAPQEARVVELIVIGEGDKQIARPLGLKEPTVRTYLNRVHQKMGTAGRVELVARVCAMRAALSAPNEGCRQK